MCKCFIRTTNTASELLSAFLCIVCFGMLGKSKLNHIFTHNGVMKAFATVIHFVSICHHVTCKPSIISSSIMYIFNVSFLLLVHTII